MSENDEVRIIHTTPPPTIAVPRHWLELKKIAQRLNVPQGSSGEIDIVVADGEIYSVPAIANAFLDRMDLALSADNSLREAVAALVGSAQILSVVGGIDKVAVRKDLFERMVALFNAGSQSS